MKWLTAALLAVALVLAGLLAYSRLGGGPQHGTTVDSQPQMPDLSLISATGQRARPFGPSEQLRLVFFGFTRCPDVCPTTLGVLARSYEALTPAQQQRLRVDFVTVDPAFDTPPRLRAYLDHFNRDFAGYTGTADELNSLRKAFFVYSNEVAPGRFQHGDTVAVLDRQGRFRRVYDGQAVAQGDLAADLGRLIRAY